MKYFLQTFLFRAFIQTHSLHYCNFFFIIFCCVKTARQKKKRKFVSINNAVSISSLSFSDVQRFFNAIIRNKNTICTLSLLTQCAGHCDCLYQPQQQIQYHSHIVHVYGNNNNNNNNTGNNVIEEKNGSNYFRMVKSTQP